MNPAILLWVAVMVFAAYKGFEFLNKYSNKPESCEGQIIEKDNDSQRVGMPGRRYRKYTYWLVFEVSGHKLTLFCDENDYDRFQVGDYGLINYTGEMMLSFTKKEK